MKYPYNVPAITLKVKELEYITQVILKKKFSGDGEFGKKCQTWIEKNMECNKVLVTPSCTHALEMAALLINIKEGDEVIMPSFTFPSTANAFVLHGARIRFVDIASDTMNIDPNVIRDAINDRARAIIVVHYAGVACDMDKIMQIARERDIYVIEDAAQCIIARYNDRYLGTIGDIGCLSFHETKNIHCGEGGAILINNPEFYERAEIIREKGTNRSNFLKGYVDKYTWMDKGSSYLLNEISSAFLLAQLEEAQTIINDRKKSWNYYYEKLSSIDGFKVNKIPDYARHNAHIFYGICRSEAERNELIKYLRARDILAIFHYVPLHSSSAGKQFGVFNGQDKYTTDLSSRLVRLPLYYGMKKEDIDFITDSIAEFYARKR
ncbi:MAG: dTDP-4-amino-4,6-dideoxygalactose transaminase [Planctomycetota bacterium]